RKWSAGSWDLWQARAARLVMTYLRTSIVVVTSESAVPISVTSGPASAPAGALPGASMPAPLRARTNPRDHVKGKRTKYSLAGRAASLAAKAATATWWALTWSG